MIRSRFNKYAGKWRSHYIVFWHVPQVNNTTTLFQVFLLHPHRNVQSGDELNINFLMTRSKVNHRLMEVDLNCEINRASGKPVPPVQKKFYIEWASHLLVHLIQMFLAWNFDEVCFQHHLRLCDMLVVCKTLLGDAIRVSGIGLKRLNVLHVLGCELADAWNPLKGKRVRVSCEELVVSSISQGSSFVFLYKQFPFYLNNCYPSSLAVWWKWFNIVIIHYI